MAVIAILSASYCHGEQVAAALADRLGYGRSTDDALVATASQGSGVPSEKLQRAMGGSPGLFNQLTREREKCVALLGTAMIELVEPDNIVYHGLGGLLLPTTLSHVLRVCLAATHEYRVLQANKEGVEAKEAKRRVEKSDEVCAEWTKFLFDQGPWDKSLYDVFLPMQSVTVDEAVDTLYEYSNRPMLATTAHMRENLGDARLAARVNTTLVERGHDTDVFCQDGCVTIQIRKYRMRMRQLQEKLEAIARQVPGVISATARPGPRCQPPGVYVQLDVDVPSKVLLVDDEKEFVHALSERLQSRSMQPAVAYDGEEALAMIKTDQPEVMVLDLKMPGIDGLEVLRRVKREHPETEVLILTGHGSDAEEVLAAQLGAFAYLRKPVDIDVLTDTMKRAYRKVNAARQAGQEASDQDV